MTSKNPELSMLLRTMADAADKGDIACVAMVWCNQEGQSFMRMDTKDSSKVPPLLVGLTLMSHKISNALWEGFNEDQPPPVFNG